MHFVYPLQGFLGFWKGVTASYWGISETVIHFVIYEALKKQLALYQDKRKGQEKTFIDFAGFMLCGACSKTCATCIAYPHGKNNKNCNDCRKLISRSKKQPADSTKYSILLTF